MTLPKLDTVVERIVELAPEPRDRRWNSLSLCIVDAVWSISANYDTTVVKVVRNLATSYEISQPLIPMTEPLPDDPLPTTVLAELTEDELLARTNRQRTSTRNGITKADAVLQYARIFNRHDVSTLRGAIALLADDARLDALDQALRKVKGDGDHGIRRGYLWMLIGQDDLIKPDRMITRWLAQFGVPEDPALARDYLTAAAPAVTDALGRAVTPWEIDHAVWNHQRTQSQS